jgi:hypothetical protein
VSLPRQHDLDLLAHCPCGQLAASETRHVKSYNSCPHIDFSPPD